MPDFLTDLVDLASEPPRSERTERGIIGFQDAAGNRQTTVPNNPLYTYVRFGEGTSRSVRAVLNVTVQPEFNLPVRVGYRPGVNEQQILGIDGDAVTFINGKIPGIVGPHDHNLPSLFDLVKPRRLYMGRVRPQFDPVAQQWSSKVYIEPHFHGGGWWPGGDVDLAAHIPTTVGMHRWVKVGINETNNTAAVAAGDEVVGAIPLTNKALAEIEMGDGEVGYCGVRLEYGMTVINSEGLFEDCTPWRSGGSGTAGIPPQMSSWDVDLPPEVTAAESDEFDGAALDPMWTEYDSGAQQTVTVAGGTVTLTRPTEEIGTSKVTGVYQALPAGDFTLDAKLKLNVPTSPAPSGGTFLAAGIALFEDAADVAKPIRLFGVMSMITGTAAPATVDFTDEITFTSANSTSPTPISTDVLMYYRLVRAGSVYTMYSSADGETWTPGQTVTPAFTPAHFGLAVYAGLAGDLISEPDGECECEFLRYVDTVRDASEPVYGAPKFSGVDHMHDAADLTYTPGVAGDWTDPDPTTVGEALDDLAARSPTATLPVTTANVSDPPTAAELDSVVGTPASKGAGYVTLVQDSDTGNVFLVTTADAATWHLSALVAAI